MTLGIRSVYDAFFRRWGHRLAETACGRRTFALIEEMRGIDRLAPHARGRTLDRFLASAVRAARFAPYYRSQFERLGLDADALASREGLRRLPVLTKDDIRRDPEAFISSRASRTPHTTRTAGSTGQPLRAYTDPAADSWTTAIMAYCRSWWGIEAGARALNLWGHSKYLGGTLRNRVRLLGRRLADAAMNRRVFPAYDLSDRQLEDFVRLVQRDRPVYVLGYASALYAAAEAALRFGASMPSVKAVVSTAEVLFDWQKETVESAFGAPVVDAYGLCEAGVVAHSCPEGSMHVADWCTCVEILDPEGRPVRPGETGRVVVTLLRCPTVPLLRYDTGDLAQELEGPCSCGRPHRLIGRVQGRAYDLIRASDGSVAPGVAFTHGMKYLSSVRRYQVIQRQMDRVDILYEACGTVAPEELSAARSRVESAIGAKFRIRFQRVDRLESEASGKFRWIRSEVSDGEPERRVAP